MRPGADLRGAAHQAQLVRVFEQAHVVEQGAQVALGVGAQGTVAGAGAHLLQPAVDAALQSGVDGEGVAQAGAVFQQRGQAGVQLLDRVGGRDAERARGRCGAEADAVPDFALQVFGLAKQGAVALIVEQQPGIGFGEAGEVVKVAVEAVRVFVVAVALALGRGGNKGDAARAQLRCQPGAARGIDLGVGDWGAGRCGRDRGRGGNGVWGVHRGIRASRAVKRSGVPTSAQGPE